MSDIVRRNGGTPAGRPSIPNLDRYLEPERMVRQHGHAISSALIPGDDGESVRNCAYRRKSVEQALARCPPMGTMQTVQSVLGQALRAEPDRRVTAAAVAVLFDSRARQPPNPRVYVEALIYDLVDEGFPPAIVVSACQNLRRTSVFTPEIAEVIAACRAVQTQYRSTLKLAGYAIEGRAKAEEVLEELERLPPQKPRPTPHANAQPGDPDW